MSKTIITSLLIGVFSIPATGSAFTKCNPYQLSKQEIAEARKNGVSMSDLLRSMSKRCRGNGANKFWKRKRW